MIFYISTIMLFLILITKTTFVTTLKGSSPSILEYTSIIFVSLILIIGVFNYIKGLKSKKIEKPAIAYDVTTKILIILSSLFVLSSFFINLNKKDVSWDATALYDARAKFLMQGVGFSQMVELSKYDPQNSYYYVLYPPYTSVLHYYWYHLGAQIPVGVIYSIFFVFLAISVFVFTKNHLGIFLASLLTLLIVSNGVIFSSSLMEYTNLPFTLQVFLGIILLYEYFEEYKYSLIKNSFSWKLIYGTGLIVTTMWIRFLEPIWLGVILTIFIVLLLKKKMLIYPILMVIFGILEYFSWQNFVSSFGETTRIISFSFSNIIKPFIGIFSGSFFSILIFFVKSWGPILFVHLFAILLAIKNIKKTNFLQIFLLMTILIYFFGLYFVSFQSEWWKSLGDSLVRSSTFMIPISCYVILEYLHEKNS